MPPRRRPSKTPPKTAQEKQQELLKGVADKIDSYRAQERAYVALMQRREMAHVSLAIALAELKFGQRWTYEDLYDSLNGAASVPMLQALVTRKKYCSIGNFKILVERINATRHRLGLQPVEITDWESQIQA